MAETAMYMFMARAFFQSGVQGGEAAPAVGVAVDVDDRLYDSSLRMRSAMASGLLSGVKVAVRRPCGSIT